MMVGLFSMIRGAVRRQTVTDETAAPPCAFPIGLPLEQALRRWTPPRTLDTLDKCTQYLKRNSRDNAAFGILRMREEVEEIFVERLFSGELCASAFVAPIKPDSARTWITCDVLRHLNFDFALSEGKWGNLHLLYIEVVRAKPELQGADKSTPLEPIKGPRDTSVTLSDDGRILSLNGEQLLFRGKVQQNILRQLVDARSRLDRVHTRTVLQKAGATADSLAKVFRGNPHWSKLKAKLHQDTGYCWLEI
jgi:hypothetical protein